MASLGLCAVLLLWAPLPLYGQNLDSADVRVPLDSALRLAREAAATTFPELSNYLLYSVTPAFSKVIRAAFIGRCNGRSELSPTADGWWSGSI